MKMLCYLNCINLFLIQFKFANKFLIENYKKLL